MKKSVSILLFVSIILCFAVFAGCSKEEKYKNDVSVFDLAEAVEAKFGAKGLSVVDEGYINGSMQIDVSDINDYVVKINVYGTNIDEYGIFKASDEEQAEEIEDMIRDYLSGREERWMPEYMPEEFPKLQSAEYKRYGEYVVYAILDEEAKAAVFAEIKAQLKA